MDMFRNSKDCRSKGKEMKRIERISPNFTRQRNKDR